MSNETTEQRVDRLETEVAAIRERLERLLVVLDAAHIISVAKDEVNA